MACSNELLQMPQRPVTVGHYHNMVEAGVFADDESFELLEGLVLPKIPRTPPHDLAIALAEEAVGKRLPKDWVRRNQSGLTTPDSEPEPDLSFVSGPLRRYTKQHPGPKDTALVVEVSEASLLRDRTLKQRIFARAKIPVYWIVNLLDRQVEVYTEPTGKSKPRYLRRQDYGINDSVPLVINGEAIDRIPVRDLLP